MTNVIETLARHKYERDYAGRCGWAEMWDQLDHDDRRRFLDHAKSDLETVGAALLEAETDERAATIRAETAEKLVVDLTKALETAEAAKAVVITDAMAEALIRHQRLREKPLTSGWPSFDAIGEETKKLYMTRARGDLEAVFAAPPHSL